MSKMKSHTTDFDSDEKRAIAIGDATVLAYIHPAKDSDVATVLSASENSPDGRSNWCWVRLMNGDLILGVFPQGETYELMEEAAQYPGDGK